jgi:hypothetical protein
VKLDAQTRDIVQTNYIRKYEAVPGGFGNVEFVSVKP